MPNGAKPEKGKKETGTNLSGVRARGESTSIDSDSMLRLVKESELEETRRRGCSRVSRGSRGSIGPGIEPFCTEVCM